MKITQNPKFFLAELPKNDQELDQLIQYQAQFSKKFHCIEVGKKSYNRYREWVCQALLGMVSGGYQQLQKKWEEDTQRNDSWSNELAQLEERFGEQLNALPDTIYIKLMEDEEGYNSLSVMENAVGLSERYRGSIEELGDFDDELDGNFEILLLEHFEVTNFLLEYPNGDKYGIPSYASYEGAKKYITDFYTNSLSEDKFDVLAVDRGDDGCESKWIILERKA